MDRYQKLADLYAAADAACLAHPSELGQRQKDPVTDEATAAVIALIEHLNTFNVDRDNEVESVEINARYKAGIGDVPFSEWAVSDATRADLPAVTAIMAAKHIIVVRRLPIYAVCNSEPWNRFADMFKHIILA